MSKQKKSCAPSIAQDSKKRNPAQSRTLQCPFRFAKPPKEGQYLFDLDPEQGIFQKQRKPQISSIPGTSPKQRDRYRVTVGDQILGERLTIDQALKLAK